MTRNKSILASLMVGLLSATLFAQTSSAGRYDTTVQTSVAHKLADNQKFNNVKSSVEDGIVTLTGTVNLYQDKLDAAKAAKKIATLPGTGGALAAGSQRASACLRARRRGSAARLVHSSGSEKYARYG